MKEYDGYLFDADGTLLDTKGPIIAAFEAMGRGMGVELPPREVISGSIGLPLYKQLRVILGQGKADSFYEEAGRIYGDGLMSNYRETLKLFPGVLEGLGVLRGLGKKMAVVTSRRLMSLEAFLQVTGIEEYFDVLVTPESTAEHKPDPAPALCAAEQLGLKPESCVFIGDAVFDIQCGKAAGMDAVLVSWSDARHDGWEVRPDLIVDDFRELLPCNFPAGEKRKDFGT